MKKYTRLNFFLLLAAALAVVHTAGGCSDKKDLGIEKAKAFPDSVVNDEFLAWVNGHPIQGKDLRIYTLIHRGGTPDSLANRAFNLKMLAGLIDKTLLWQEGVALGLSVDDSTSRWHIREMIKAVGGTEAIDQLLESSGVSRTDMELLIEKDLVVREFMEVNIAGGLAVDDSLARAYYEENIHEFTTGDSVRARHILLRTYPEDTEAARQELSKIIHDLRDRILAGEDFATLARDYSQGPRAPQGGDLGYFTKREMVGSLAETTFSLERGQVSDVIQTALGYHLILVEDKIPSRVLAFEEIKRGLKEQIRGYLMQGKLRYHLQRSREVAIIERNF